MLTMPLERITRASSASGLPITAGATPSGRKISSRCVSTMRDGDDFLIAEGDDALAQAIHATA